LFESISSQKTEREHDQDTEQQTSHLLETFFWICLSDQLWEHRHQGWDEIFIKANNFLLLPILRKPPAENGRM